MSEHHPSTIKVRIMSDKCALRKIKPSHVCRIEQQKVASELEKLQNILESKEAQMARVMNGDGQIASLRGRYDHMFKELQAERDDLKKERLELFTGLLASFCPPRRL